MGKIIINRVFLVLILFLSAFSLSSVKAETCDYKFRAEAAKIAKNVEASYEIKTNDDGTSYVVINVYNLVDDIYVSYTTSGGSTNTMKNIFGHDTNGTGIYTFIDYDTDKVVKYTFKVYSINSECTNLLRSITLTKPKYNIYSELPECNYYDVENFLYCQKWVTTNFNMSEAAIIERINDQRDKIKKTVTTVCISCEEEREYNEWLARFKKVKKYMIIGLSIGIVVDIVIIILLFRKIKEDSII